MCIFYACLLPNAFVRFMLFIASGLRLMMLRLLFAMVALYEAHVLRLLIILLNFVS